LVHTWAFDIKRHPVDVYYGVGAVLGSSGKSWVTKDGKNYFVTKDNSIGLGARGVLGLASFLPNAPLDVFFEIVPQQRDACHTAADWCWLRCSNWHQGLSITKKWNSGVME
jgi:hypothetical protein